LEAKRSLKSRARSGVAIQVRDEVLLGHDPRGVGGSGVVREARVLVEGLGRVREAVARGREDVALPGVAPPLELGQRGVEIGRKRVVASVEREERRRSAVAGRRRVPEARDVEDAVEGDSGPQARRPRGRERDGGAASEAPAERGAFFSVDGRRGPQRVERGARPRGEDGGVAQRLPRRRGLGRVPPGARGVSEEVRDEDGAYDGNELLRYLQLDCFRTNFPNHFFSHWKRESTVQESWKTSSI